MIYSVHSSKTLEELDQSLRNAVQQHQFGILNVLDLKQTLANKGIELGHPCRVYDVCNPKAAAEALRHDPRISAVLPCRISVFEQGDGRVLSTVPPTDLIRATGIAGMEELAASMDATLREVLHQAA